MEMKDTLCCNADISLSINDSSDSLLLSPGSHDSCYDSDSSYATYRDLSQYSDHYHSDVSRTSSDTPSETLGAEFEGHYVIAEEILSHPQCKRKAEFAIKLGYSTRQIKKVFMKCGMDISENDLLNELVQLEDTESSCEDIRQVLDDGDTKSESDNLRPIIIDGSNVAMCHGNNEIFSCYGIKEVVQWFQQRGHQNIIVFVPQWRKESSRPDAPITDQDILYELEKQKLLVFTPSRRMDGKRIICDDDRYIVKEACRQDGIIVSNDFYRELKNEKPEYKRVIEKQQLMYSFVSGRFSPPDDPLGKHGPTLDAFLRKNDISTAHGKKLCPFMGKCTYGNKCKYYHPDRDAQKQKAVIDKLLEKQKTISAGLKPPGMALQKTKSAPTKKSLSRTESVIPHQSLNTLKQPIDRTLPVVKSTMSIPSILSSSPTTIFDGTNYNKIVQFKNPSSSSQSNMKEFFESGHLALAKKLSDEDVRLSGTLAKESRGLGVSGTASPLHRAALGCSQLSPVNNGKSNGNHLAVARQLTLLGPEDKRLSHYASNSCLLQIPSSGISHEPLSRHASDPCRLVKNAQSDTFCGKNHGLSSPTNASKTTTRGGVQFSFGNPPIKQVTKPSMQPVCNWSSNTVNSWCDFNTYKLSPVEAQRCPAETRKLTDNYSMHDDVYSTGNIFDSFNLATPEQYFVTSSVASLSNENIMSTSVHVSSSNVTSAKPPAAFSQFASCNSQYDKVSNSAQYSQQDLFSKLSNVFDPMKVRYVLANHPTETNVEVLCRYILDLQLSEQ